MVPQPQSPASLSHPDIRQSEFECLNLNVWAPAEALNGSASLPVIAWVHGGGYMVGHNAVQADGSHLVRRSVELGKPVLVVAMNYRMHILGLVGCQELHEEARGLGEHGYYNLGLHDQRLGFQWIQRHIHLFGGSPTAVTAIGES
ncbi:alpha/beta-hydrolase, partial [Thozetella sp. PMI_491]